MNITIDRIKEYCRNNSFCSNNISRMNTIKNVGGINKNKRCSTAKNISIHQDIERQLYILLEYIDSFGSVQLQLIGEKSKQTITLRHGNIFYNGRVARATKEKSKSFVFILQLDKEHSVSSLKLAASIKINGSAEIGRVKTFKDQNKLNNFIQTQQILNHQDKIVKFTLKDLQQIKNQCFFLKENNLRNNRSKHRKLLSFIDKRSSISTSISKVPSVYKSKKNLNNIQEIKLNQLLVLGKYIGPSRKLMGFKNKSQCLTKNIVDSSSREIKSLQNNSQRDSSVLLPRTKEDIDKIYEVQKKRFNNPEPANITQSQAIQQDIHNNYKYEDFDSHSSFFGNEICKQEDKKQLQQSESGLAVSEFI